MNREIENIKREIYLHRQALQTRKEVVLAEINKEREMLDKFEKWVENVEREMGSNDA